MAAVHLWRSGDNCGLLGTELAMPGLAACALSTGPSCQPLFIISKPHLFILCICCPVPEFKFCKYTFHLFLPPSIDKSPEKLSIFLSRHLQMYFTGKGFG